MLTPRCLERPCGGPFENRKAEEMALLFLSSNLSPWGGLSTTLITLASKPNQVALTSWLHLPRVALDKGTFFSGTGGKMKGLGRLELASTSRKPCLFSVQVRRFWLALDLGSALLSPGCCWNDHPFARGCACLGVGAELSLDQQGSGRACPTCSSRFPLLQNGRSEKFHISEWRRDSGKAFSWD